mgnify:CR=1 FL=1
MCIRSVHIHLYVRALSRPFDYICMADIRFLTEGPGLESDKDGPRNSYFSGFRGSVKDLYCLLEGPRNSYFSCLRGSLKDFYYLQVWMYGFPQGVPTI